MVSKSRNWRYYSQQPKEEENNKQSTTTKHFLSAIIILKKIIGTLKHEGKGRREEREGRVREMDVW